MKARNGSSKRDRRRYKSNPKLHQITFCDACGEAIPAKALTCFKCGHKQSGVEQPLQVLFCEDCGNDYPARAIVCFHCGHQNTRHPIHRGHIS